MAGCGREPEQSYPATAQVKADLKRELEDFVLDVTAPMRVAPSPLPPCAAPSGSAGDGERER